MVGDDEIPRVLEIRLSFIGGAYDSALIYRCGTRYAPDEDICVPLPVPLDIFTVYHGRRSIRGVVAVTDLKNKSPFVHQSPIAYGTFINDLSGSGPEVKRQVQIKFQAAVKMGEV